MKERIRYSASQERLNRIKYFKERIIPNLIKRNLKVEEIFIDADAENRIFRITDENIVVLYQTRSNVIHVGNYREEVASIRFALNRIVFMFVK
jgi:predicted restriction endonuclease